MKRKELPSYAVFDEYRYTQRIAVTVRWFLLFAWLFTINYRPSIGMTLWSLDSMGVGLVALNGYVQWRIWKGRPITKRYVIALSAMDLGIITAGIGMTTRFDNTNFVFYYPALLGLSLIFSWQLNFVVVTLVAVAYAGLSFALKPGVIYAEGDEKILIVRIATMFAVVAAANLLTSIERARRREAVEAERVQSQRNLELQRKAQEERSRIAREIHDGIAQSIYMLSLHLETCADLAAQRRQDLKGRLDKMVALSKQTLLEVRHYIFDLKPYLAGERGAVSLVENQVREFNRVAGVPVALETAGEEHQVPVDVATCLYRVTQEALANAFKHAHASRVKVLLEFVPGWVQLAIQDDGQGFDTSTAVSGHGISNMRQRAEELGGAFSLTSAPGTGTRVIVRLPC